MDFVYLVEKGTYSKKDLKKDQKDFINGIEFAMDELDCVLDTVDEDASILDKLVAEIKQETVEEIKKHLYITICEAIVAFEDDNAAEE